MYSRAPFKPNKATGDRENSMDSHIIDYSFDLEYSHQSLFSRVYDLTQSMFKASTDKCIVTINHTGCKGFRKFLWKTKNTIIVLWDRFLRIQCLHWRIVIHCIASRSFWGNSLIVKMQCRIQSIRSGGSASDLILSLSDLNINRQKSFGCKGFRKFLWKNKNKI